MCASQVTAFRAKDGTLFETRDEADKHDDFVQVCDIYETCYPGSIGTNSPNGSITVTRVFAITRELMLHRQIIKAASDTTESDKQASTLRTKIDPRGIELLVSARKHLKALCPADATEMLQRNEVISAIKAYLNNVYGSTDRSNEPEQPTPER